jgi:hypothetical protein
VLHSPIELNAFIGGYIGFATGFGCKNALMTVS